MSTAVFEALPGIDTPVDRVRSALASVWDVEPSQGREAPSEFRASQMNLVLHFGLDTTPEQAVATFADALSFSRRYPCRIIALCPRQEGGGGDVSAKIFCECYIGKSQEDMTCSEAIVLTYPLEQRAYLENQASIMLESDLPVYYWPQHINLAKRLGDYKLFLREAQRVIIDSSIEKPDVPAYDWPNPESVRDLVHARMLPVRQSVGHFLSYIPPERILGGLERVTVSHQTAFGAEARVVTGWTRKGIAGCASAVGAADRPPVDAREDAELKCSIVIEWSYSDGKSMSFSFDFDKGTACLKSDLLSDAATLNSTVRPLNPEGALAEAIFF